MCYKKTKHAKFLEKRTFLTPWGKKCSFSRKLDVALFSCNIVLRFALLSYYRRKDNKKSLLFARYMVLRNGVPTLLIKQWDPTLQTQSWKWALTALAYLLDAVRVNANPVWKSKEATICMVISNTACSTACSSIYKGKKTYRTECSSFEQSMSYCRGTH